MARLLATKTCIYCDSKHAAGVCLGTVQAPSHVQLALDCQRSTLYAQHRLRLTMQHVYGHAGNLGNECADHAAALGSLGFISNHNNTARWCRHNFDTNALCEGCNNIITLTHLHIVRVATASVRFWKDWIALGQKQQREFRMRASCGSFIGFQVHLSLVDTTCDFALSLSFHVFTLLFRRGDGAPKLVCLYRIELWRIFCAQHVEFYFLNYYVTYELTILSYLLSMILVWQKLRSLVTSPLIHFAARKRLSHLAPLPEVTHFFIGAWHHCRSCMVEAWESGNPGVLFTAQSDHVEHEYCTGKSGRAIDFPFRHILLGIGRGEELNCVRSRIRSFFFMTPLSATAADGGAPVTNDEVKAKLEHHRHRSMTPLWHLCVGRRKDSKCHEKSASHNELRARE